MTCVHYEELLPAYLDGDLAEDARGKVAEHVATCPNCRALLQNLRRLDTLAAFPSDLPRSMRPYLARIDANVHRYLHSRHRPTLAVRLLQYGWRATATTVPLGIVAVFALLVVLLGGPVLRSRLSLETARPAASVAVPSTRPFAAKNTTPVPSFVPKSTQRSTALAGATTLVGHGSATPLPSLQNSAVSAPIRELPAPIISLALDPSNARTIYALLATDAFYRSDDAGQTWLAKPLPFLEHTTLLASSDQESPVYLVSQTDVVVSAGQPNRIYVAAAHVLYRSDDRGATWTSVHDSVGAWAMADARGNDLYVWHDPATSADRGLYRSTDAGRTWTEVYTGAFPPALGTRRCPCSREGIIVLAVDPRSANTLYAGTDFGVYRSSDGGKTWNALDQGLPATVLPYRSTPLVAVTGDGTVYAVTDVWTNPTTSRAALLRMGPGEDSWTEIGVDGFAKFQDSQQAFHGINALVADPSSPNQMYLGTAHGLAESDDAGKSWRSVSIPNGRVVYRVAVETGKAIGNPPPVRPLDLGTDHGFVRLVPPR